MWLTRLAVCHGVVCVAASRLSRHVGRHDDSVKNIDQVCLEYCNVDEDQHISEFLSSYNQAISKQVIRNNLELASAISQWHSQMYLYDSFLTNSDGNKRAQALWEILHMSLLSLLEMLTYFNEGTGLRPPTHLALLASEIGNLRSGVPARLLRLDGANLGDNTRGGIRTYILLHSAVFLRRFMDRDGHGSQKAAARKIAKALSGAGLKPPGNRTDGAYTGRTIEGWMRLVSQPSELRGKFQDTLEACRKAETSLSLEGQLADFVEIIKSLHIEPHDLRKNAGA